VKQRLPKKNKNEKGILLLEVVVAVAVLATGLTMVSSSFTTILRVAETSKDYNTAIALADQVIFEEFEMKVPEEWPSQGDFKEDPFSWSQSSQDVEGRPLKALQLDVKWRRRNRDYRLKINTYMPYEEET